MFLKIFDMEFISDLITKEEAAIICLQKKVEFVWKPQIVELPITSNVVDFEKFKKKGKSR